MIGRDLGIHNAAFNEAVKVIQLTGYAVRSLRAMQVLYAEALAIVNALQGANTAGEAANTASKLTSAAATDVETASTLGLAAAFDALWAAMGPLGWAMLAGGLIAGGAVGFGLAGGFGGGAAAPVAAGAVGETTNIYMGNVNMQTRQDAEATATNLATIYQHRRRTRGG